jgi:L-cysteine desulfidase
MSTVLNEYYISLLREELVPALGCTEPIAIALAAAKARQILGVDPVSVELVLSLIHI